MGKFKDLTGCVFHELEVKERIEDYVSSGGVHSVQYRCLCSCGNYKNVTAGKLKTGHVKSCGKCNAYSTFKDLTGQVFDKLKVIEQDGYYEYPNGERDYKWKCECECGNIVTLRGNSLKAKRHHSCKRCQNGRTVIDEMLSKKEFGKLTIIERADDTFTKKGTVIDWWRCKCKCGSEVLVRGANLRNGHTSSCGCYRLEMLSSETYQSKYEKAVSLFLDEKGVCYQTQKTFPNLVGVGGNLLSYDFCVDIDNQLYLIECNGLQHYESVDFFGGNQVFGRQKVHDYRKKIFAQDNGYPLLVINCVNTTVDAVCNEVSNFLNI